MITDSSSLNLIYLILFLNLILVGCQVNKEDLFKDDFRLFNNTTGFELAKAVKKQDTSKFKKIIEDSRINIDFEEDKYGSSLLQLAVINKLEKSVAKLLELGADPNHYDKYSGYSVMHDAVGYYQNNDDTTILSLLLKHKGDPNIQTRYTKNNTGANMKNVLSILSSNPNEQASKAEILLRYGASLQFDFEDNTNYLVSAIRRSNYKLVLLYLQYGTNFRAPLFTRFGNKVYIQEYMKEYMININSDEYEYKLKVIEFLEDKGIDYKGVVPPKRTVELIKQNYPDTWEDYLSKY